jgi:hypothetical protein
MEQKRNILIFEKGAGFKKSESSSAPGMKAAEEESV